MANVTLEQAERWIEKACAKATQLGVKVSVCVVDAGGNPVALARMDGANILSPDIARGRPTPRSRSRAIQRRWRNA